MNKTVKWILIGLGATRLSMNINSIPRIRRIISGIAFEEAREIVKELVVCRTAEETEEMVKASLSAKWSHLFPSENFSQKKS